MEKQNNIYIIYIVHTYMNDISIWVPSKNLAVPPTVHINN